MKIELGFYLTKNNILIEITHISNKNVYYPVAGRAVDSKLVYNFTLNGKFVGFGEDNECDLVKFLGKNEDKIPEYFI